MEEQASVVAVAEGIAWVEKERQSHCGGCSLRNGCGSAVLAKVMGARRNRIRVLDPLSAHVGDEVIFQLDAAALLRGSFAVYMVPLFGLFVGAMVGKYSFVPIFTDYANSVIALFAILGFFVGVGWLSRFSRRVANDKRYQPVITRIVTPIEPT